MASIEKVFITNFKSYKSYSLSIDNNIKHVVVYGYNGVGKTNLLDSISYFSNSKGLRGSSIEEILPKNQSKDKNTQIEIQIRSLKKNILNFSLRIINDGNQFKKKFFLDQRKTSLTKIKDYIKIIWLSPYMDKIMYEGQTLKRNFIDKLIAQNDGYFNKTMLNLKKDVSERLNILKHSKDEKWLNLIERKIAVYIFEIFDIRRKYAEKLNMIINTQLNQFRKIRLEYKNKLFSNLQNKDKLTNLFLEELKNKRELDEITKRTHFSINTDEISIVDIENNISIDACSTGEQKSSLLTIILANCWKLKNDNKEFILLLDEATSHLDAMNFKKLFDEVDKFGTQIWYTGTHKKLFQVIENKGFFIHLQ
tara:strand:+ start:8407 stop:9501 length:1095 start_codon:yes stop_codon:yes gene_type:complete